jgi:hypothetical protein
MRANPGQNYIIVPSSVLLTMMVLSGTARKLPTDNIRDLVDIGIEELDRRSGDPDLEPDFDTEDESVE